MKALFVSLALLAAAVPAAAYDIPYSAVVVNGEKITAARIRTDLEGSRHAQASLHGGRQREPGKEEIDVAIDRLVTRQLMIQEALARGFMVKANELAAAWESEKSRWGSEEQLAKSLKVRGVSEPFLKERIVEDLLIRKLIAAAVDGKVKVTERDERAYFEKNTDRFVKDVPPQLRMICFDYAKHGGEAGAKARYDAFWGKFSRGGDFAALAKEYSDHPSAAQGGAVEENADPALPFLEVGRTLRPSGFCAPQSDTKALYIYWRERRPPAMSFEEARPKVHEAVVKQQKEQLFTDLVKGLKGKAKIEYLK